MPSLWAISRDTVSPVGAPASSTMSKYSMSGLRGGSLHGNMQLFQHGEELVIWRWTLVSFLQPALYCFSFHRVLLAFDHYILCLSSTAEGDYTPDEVESR